ncbi:unnamed protein product [Nesidiocoris tenuis]|uniref:Uncharacterized protein n=1 Tax=Nesidiocoris tenuis TaxID=355587 RepID=A0A6H5G6B8_9HEMI|nr:unnamed protein product [Nesidiocoris tenuis]
MSELTWPPSPSSEVDDIMRQYLPELYEHEAQEDLDMMTSETVRNLQIEYLAIEKNFSPKIIQDDQLIKEKEILNDLLHKLRAFEAEKDMHLKTSHAMSQHLQGEKRRLAEEKMKQLTHMERLIQQLEREAEMKNATLKLTEEEKDKLEKVGDLLNPRIRQSPIVFPLAHRFSPISPGGCGSGKIQGQLGLRSRSENGGVRKTEKTPERSVGRETSDSKRDIALSERNQKTWRTQSSDVKKLPHSRRNFSRRRRNEISPRLLNSKSTNFKPPVVKLGSSSLKFIGWSSQWIRKFDFDFDNGFDFEIDYELEFLFHCELDFDFYFAFDFDFDNEFDFEFDYEFHFDFDNEFDFEFDYEFDFEFDYELEFLFHCEFVFEFYYKFEFLFHCEFDFDSDCKFDFDFDNEFDFEFDYEFDFDFDNEFDFEFDYEFEFLFHCEFEFLFHCELDVEFDYKFEFLFHCEFDFDFDYEFDSVFEFLFHCEFVFEFEFLVYCEFDFDFDYEFEVWLHSMNLSRFRMSDQTNEKDITQLESNEDKKSLDKLQIEDEERKTIMDPSKNGSDQKGVNGNDVPQTRGPGGEIEKKKKDHGDGEEKADLLVETPCSDKINSPTSPDEKKNADTPSGLRLPPVLSNLKFSVPFFKRSTSLQDQSDGNVQSPPQEGGTDEPSRKPKLINAIRLPLASLVPKKLKSKVSRDDDSFFLAILLDLSFEFYELHFLFQDGDVEAGGGAQAGLASVETLDDADASKGQHDDGMENVKLDAVDVSAAVKVDRWISAYSSSSRVFSGVFISWTRFQGDAEKAALENEDESRWAKQDWRKWWDIAKEHKLTTCK